MRLSSKYSAKNSIVFAHIFAGSARSLARCDDHHDGLQSTATLSTRLPLVISSLSRQLSIKLTTTMAQFRVCIPALLLQLILIAVHYTGSVTAYSLQGKRVVVTGSSGGIGKGIALLCAAQGAHVVVHYHTRAQGAAQTADAISHDTSGTVAGVFGCDFRDPAAIQKLFADDLDGIWPEGFDVLVNNAGIVTKMALEDDNDHTLSAWHETLQVNLHAPRLLSHLALPRMRKRTNSDGGVILNVSSIHGEKSNEYMGAYAVSKSALDALTRAMALEYAVYNIRVNAIAPGVVPVERTAAAFADQTVADPWLERIPLHRLGTVEQVAAACLPLITNEWLTGVIWQIDGGMMARSNMPERPRPSPIT
jgi:glucose 1-dehydrogenase